MYDYVDLGPVPCMEECAQVGSPDYAEQSRKECRAFKNQILRQFPPPEGATIVVRNHAHDFGFYREVAVKNDVSSGEAENYAYMLDENIFERWDETALEELK